MEIFYRIVPTSNTILKSQDGLTYVIKTIYCDVQAFDTYGNEVVMTDLLTIMPDPNPAHYLDFNDITEKIMIDWIIEIDTFDLDSIKKSLEMNLIDKANSNVIVNGKLPWE
jgi:hypothetical protein